MAVSCKQSERLEDEVYSHYFSREDTLKLRAAEYVLGNIDYHTVLWNKKSADVQQALYGSTRFKPPQIIAKVDSLSRIWKFRPDRFITRATPLREVARSDDVVKHIDHAFDTWRQAPWADSISFEIFCNYILPMATMPGGPQLDWRSYYDNKMGWLRDSILIAGSPDRPIQALLDSSGKEFRHIPSYRTPGTYGPIDMMEMQTGTCVQHSQLLTMMAQSVGIPAAYLRIPQWGNQRGSHAELGTVDYQGKVNSVFLPVFMVELIPGKIYMSLYHPNPNSLAVQAEETTYGALPNSLESPRIVDVTGSIIPASDVTLELHDHEAGKHEFVYLSLFNPKGWVPVAWAKPQNGTAKFTEMGRQVLYMPTNYSKHGLHEVATPLTIRHNGEIEEFELDTSEWGMATFKRKNPLRTNFSRYTRFFRNAVLEAGDDPSFTDARVLDTISREPGSQIVRKREDIDRYWYHQYWDSTVFDIPVETQFARFRADSNYDCFIGELEFYDEDGNILTGTLIGSAANPEYVQDGINGEAYRDTVDGGWVGIDFGSVQRVKKIKWLPSDDSNSIQTGDEYELVYWSDNEWISLGKQTATSPLLQYRIPKKSILWLKCLTRGQDERPFIYDWDLEKQLFY